MIYARPLDGSPSPRHRFRYGLSIVTMSKPWGACGVSIGWLAFHDLSIRQRLVDVQYFGAACPSRASELQAIMVLRASEQILAKNMAIIRRNLGLLDAFMARHADLFEWVRPTAGAIAFLRFKGPLSSSELGEQLAAAGIGIKPAYCFTDVVSRANDYFRVGYGEECFSRCLDALAAFVDSHRKKWQPATSQPGARCVPKPGARCVPTTTYCSTRGGERGVPFEKALLSAYAADGGLYVPECMPALSRATLRSWAPLSMAQVCARVMQLFTGMPAATYPR